jgi:dTDP-glucose pyrophosphorylase
MLLDTKNLKKIILKDHVSILQIINNLNLSGLKVVLIVNKKNNFVGLINDGDIRRGFAKGYNIKTKAKFFLKKNPFVLKSNIQLKNIPRKVLNSYISIPIIKNKKIYGLYANNLDYKKSKKIKEHVVIMAGGFGKRLGTLTKNCPKALLKFNNKPLLQYIIEHLKKNNFYKIHLSIFYLKKKIKEFIKKKNSFSININFIEEKSPLGSIGSLKLIKSISNNFVVLNCDVISEIDLNNVLNFHKKNNSIMTMCVKNFQYKNPYGVIISKNNNFISFKEKPETNFSINAGVYIFNKKIIKIMIKYKIQNIEDLIIFLKKRKYKISTYQIFENWRDFGSDKKNLRKI